MSGRSAAACAVLAAAFAVAACGNGEDERSDTVTRTQRTATSERGGTFTLPASTTTTADGDAQEQPPIVVTSPDAFDIVVDSLVLAGTAEVFEANVRWSINRGEHEVLQEGFTTASCGNGCRGAFRTKIVLDEKVEPGNYTLLVFEESAEDGSKLHTVPVPITVHATRD